MKIQGASADGTEAFIYYNYSDSVPSTMPFQNDSSYTVNATANNDFSVTFNGIKPSYYATAWNTQNITFAVWENPDSTSLMALPLLTSLHSRMLAGQDLSGLKLTNFAVLFHFVEAQRVKAPGLSCSIRLAKVAIV
jgi:hypothetical protein